MDSCKLSNFSKFSKDIKGSVNRAVIFLICGTVTATCASPQGSKPVCFLFPDYNKRRPECLSASHALIFSKIVVNGRIVGFRVVAGKGNWEGHDPLFGGKLTEREKRQDQQEHLLHPHTPHLPTELNALKRELEEELGTYNANYIRTRGKVTPHGYFDHSNSTFRSIEVPNVYDLSRRIPQVEFTHLEFFEVRCDEDLDRCVERFSRGGYQRPQFEAWYDSVRELIGTRA